MSAKANAHSPSLMYALAKVDAEVTMKVAYQLGCLSAKAKMSPLAIASVPPMAALAETTPD